ncbi:MAG: hypothetical protein NTV86_06565 [Planctomycetota bacterium]|nr:hypothetical protein [Planctomycetota bacterium]
MRLGLIIILLTAIGVSLVHLRVRADRVRGEMYRLQIDQVSLRRQIWDCQVQLTYLTTPEAVRQRMEQMKLDVTEGQSPEETPVADPARTPRRR